MAGVGLVFAMSLIMTGLAESFSREVDRTLDAVGGEAWAVSDQASGPFTSFNPVPVEAGGIGAEPMMVLRQTVRVAGDVLDVVVLGRSPVGSDGVGPGQAVVDEALVGAEVGSQLSLGGLTFEITGSVSGQRLFAGLPTVYISLADAQQIGVRGQPLATAFLYATAPSATPEGLRLMTRDEVKQDVLRPLENALASIRLMKVLLWIVAATIIGSVLYLQAMERTRDFAVFKATGTSTAAIGAGLALQAIVLSLAAAVLAAILAVLLAPMFPMNIEIPTTGFLMLPVVTVAVGLLASLIALRKTATVEPALAFGG
jgi:putative ABC transport system permease protein